MLENRSKLDEERMDFLTAQLKEARLEAEDADSKSEQMSRQLALVEDELEVVEERVKSTEAYVLVDIFFVLHPPPTSASTSASESLKPETFANCRKIAEKEDKLRIVGGILKSLEVSEEKVRR